MTATLGTWLTLLLWARPAPAGRDRGVPVDDPCGLDRVYSDQQALAGFRFQPGYGTGASETEALDAARTDARSKLMENLGCANQPPWEDQYCDAIRLNVDPWSGHAKPLHGRTWEACATAALPQESLDEIKNAAPKLDDDMMHLAGDVTAAAAGRPLGLMPPTWTSGCGAGDAGRTVQSDLRRAFARLDDGPKLLIDSDYHGDAASPRLLLRMDEQGGIIVINASMVHPADCTEDVVGSVRFPSTLLHIDPNSAGHCAGDKTLGTSARGACARGLSVQVDVPAKDGVLCAGDVLAPTVQVSQPARLRVYSVVQDGTATLVFPMGQDSDRVDRQVTLGPFDAVYQEGAGEERLVAVAVPLSGDFGRSRSWKGNCQVPGAWSPELLPATAASSASTFVVLAPGEAACADGPRVQYQHQAAPPCVP